MLNGEQEKYYIIKHFKLSSNLCHTATVVADAANMKKQKWKKILPTS